jgi:predicted component of type VI protein secretion system
MPPVGEREGAGHTMVYSTAARIAEPLREPAVVRSQRALLLYKGRRLLVGPTGATIGRSRQSDIVIDDPNVSRQHVEVRPRGGAWVLTDLGSTNGSRLNGRQITSPEVIQPGDEIEIGTSVITFELE